MAEPKSWRKLVARIGARICWHGGETVESHQRIGNAIDENTYVHATFVQSKTVNGCFKTAIRRILDFELIVKKERKVISRTETWRERNSGERALFVAVQYYCVHMDLHSD